MDRAMPDPDGHSAPRPIRVAAAGDVHCREGNRDEVIGAFAALADDVDLDVLAAELDGYSAADCVALLREAALAHVKANKP